MKITNMNIALKVIILGVFSFCIGCSKSNEEPPSLPNDLEIDIDEDGNVDYRVEYNFVLIESPTTSGGITGRIIPSGKNEFLRNREDKNLFLENLDVVNETVSEPLFWNKPVGLTIVSISNNSISETWPSSWKVESDSIQDSYYVGLKLINNNTIRLAWCEFKIETSNGQVTVINKGIL